MKYVIVQIYRFEVEFELLKTMELEFNKHGFSMLLWTNTNINAANFQLIPLEFTKSEEVFFSNSFVRPINNFDYSTWGNHINKLEELYSTKFDIYDCEHIANYSYFIFRLFNPALFICWSGFEPCYAISREIAILQNIPTIVWEAGMLPSTLVLEPKGLMSHSQLANKNIGEIISHSKNAEAYLSKQKNALTQESLSILKDGWLNILILGSMDIANGCYYPNSKFKHDLGDFEDSIDIALKLNTLSLKCNIKYRPHPREPKGQLKRLHNSNITIDLNTSLEKSILESDIVIGYGSKADFTALILDIPFVFVGKGILTGKSCCYEAMNIEELQKAIFNASINLKSESHKVNFEKLIGYLLNSYLYNRLDNKDCKKNITNLVNDALQFANHNESTAIYENEISSHAIEVRNKHCEEYSFHEKFLAGKLSAINKIKRDIQKSEIDTVIIDFDHTLWLGNTTEQFINISFPRLPCEILDGLVSKIWLKYQSRLRKSIEKDHLRILVIILLTPWNLFLWNSFCKKNINKYWNEGLYNTIVQSGKEKLIISLGFDILIKTILKIKFGSQSKLEVFASKLFDFSKNIRKVGKVETIRSRIRLKNSYAITDSIEDKDLLINAHSGILHNWEEPRFEKQLGYFPFRYLRKGKYLNKGYFKKYILQQELIVWLFLFAYNINFVLPALLLFFSFQLIYEIGYYENDFIGAKNETNPRLLETHIDFSKYNIGFNAWFFSLLIMFTALYLFNSSDLIQNSIIWLIVLLLLRITFHFYNRSIPSKRKELYFILQFFKNFSGIVILIPNIVGLMLAISNMLQHYIRYIIYRTDGNYDAFDNFLARIVFFCTALAIVAILKIQINLIIATLALIWLIYRWNLHSKVINKIYSRIVSY